MKSFWKNLLTIFASLAVVLLLATFSNGKSTSAASSPTNSVLGVGSLAHITTGAYNTSIGYKALYMNTTGSNNVAIGNLAGVSKNQNYANLRGSNNVFIGAYTGVSSGSFQLSNSSAIGAFSTIEYNNSINIGCHQSINGCPQNTNVGIDNPNPLYPLDVNGNINLSGSLTFGGGNPICTYRGCVDINTGTNLVKNSVNLYSENIALFPSSPTTVGVKVVDNSAQSSDLLELQDTSFSNLFSVGPTGNVNVKTNLNTTTALQVNNSSNQPVFDVDTTNTRVGIGTNTPAYSLDVAGSGTINASNGLYIGGKLICSSTGCVSNSPNTPAPTVLYNNHIVMPVDNSAATLTTSPGVAAGTSAKAYISGNDVAGNVYVNTGLINAGVQGVIINIVFAHPYDASTTPIINLTPTNALSSTSGYYVSNVTNTGFSISVANATLAGTKYSFNFQVLQ